YQDTNHAQGEIVDHLASQGSHVMVVGDDAQAIYAFRGADYRNILGFPERYPDAAIYKLTVNYRSTPPILHLANALFESAPAHFRKELRPVKRGGYKPALVACRDSAEEAMFIASRILDLREEGVSLRQMGVLMRSHANALELELELRKRRIPFQVRGGLRFTEQAHIKDVLAHLIVVVNGRDELSWLRIFKLQKKVAQKRAADLWGGIAAAPDPLQAFLGGAGGDYGTLGQLRSLLKEVLVLPPAEGIAAIAESHYRDVVFSKYPNPHQRLEDLQQLATYASKFSEVHDFLEDIALLGGLSAEEIVATEDPDERITLSTIHQAKGLEWPVVFIPHVVEGILPHWLAL
ncbi:MAG TPA: ATP-dependent helicase, partial [bacterium]|nr:ATP-dependent helicase [bacterium]